MVEKFTKVLYELVVEKNLSIEESLKIISKNYSKTRNNLNSFFGGNVITKTACFLLDEMMNGAILSNSMRRCSYINFGDIYISFINCAERSGNIKETLTYLKKKYERKKENQFKLVEAVIYPVVVICLAVGGILFLHISNLFEINNNVIFYISVLLFITVLIFIGIFKALSENKLYEAFLAVGFLLKAGVNLYDAVGYGGQILGITTKYGEKFQEAREKLLLGMDLEQAFCLGEKYSNAFFYADKGGGKIEVFEKMANWIGDIDEKKRSICISLIEPISILITGVFLIIVVANIFMPYISQFSFL